MTDAQALFEHGLAALEAEDFPEAVEALTRAIAADPRVAAGYRLRSKAYLALGDRPKAIADLDAAIRLKPGDAQVHAERAAELLKQRRYADTIADCDTALILDPGRVDLFAIRGRAYANMGESTAAFRDFDRAIHADTERAAEHLTQRARLHLECGNADAARADADMALQIDATLLLAYEIRALAQRELGEFEQAASDFQRAAQDPHAIAPRIGRLIVLHELQNWTALIDSATEVLACPTPPVQAFDLRGRAHLALGQHSEAINDFSRIIAAQPHRASGYALRGIAHEAAGNAPAAQRDYLDALARNPDDADTLNRLAWLLTTNLELKNLDHARELATRACERTDWTNANMLDTLAMACAELGDCSNAIRYLEQALTIEDRPEFGERVALYRSRVVHE